MAANPEQLRVFQKAGHLGAALYEVSDGIPLDEPYCLQSRIRQTSTNIPVLIVKGYGQKKKTAFRVEIRAALKEASELRYLLGLAHRMTYLGDDLYRSLDQECSDLVGTLHEFLMAPDEEPLLELGAD